MIPNPTNRLWLFADLFMPTNEYIKGGGTNAFRTGIQQLNQHFHAQPAHHQTGNTWLPLNSFAYYYSMPIQLQDFFQ